MSSVYETERLRIRPWQALETDRYVDMYSRWEVVRFLGSAPVRLTSPQEARSRIERWNAVAPGPPYGIWAVEVRETGLVAGTVLLVPVPEAADGTVEVGWHLHPDSWGFGYATEAARGALERGHGAGLSELVALVAAENTASLAVCRRLRLEPAGPTTRYYGKELEVFVSRA